MRCYQIKIDITRQAPRYYITFAATIPTAIAFIVGELQKQAKVRNEDVEIRATQVSELTGNVVMPGGVDALRVGILPTL